MIMLKIILKENNWLDRKYLDFGWGNGYVIIPKDHKSFDMDLDMLAVHGGVTFNKVLTDEDIKYYEYLDHKAIGSRIIGFDTCHLSDTLKKWPKTKVFKEAKELRTEIDKLVKKTE